MYVQCMVTWQILNRQFNCDFPFGKFHAPRAFNRVNTKIRHCSLPQHSVHWAQTSSIINITRQFCSLINSPPGVNYIFLMYIFQHLPTMADRHPISLQNSSALLEVISGLLISSRTWMCIMQGSSSSFYRISLEITLLSEQSLREITH